MKAKISRTLVIDASVARASGSEIATYPTSVHCRDFLQTVLSVCHRVVMTPDIRDEWNKHNSRFAREWLRRMIAKKKLVPLVADIETSRILWGRVEKLTNNDKQRAEMLKDLCLLEAAIATDKTVISLDDKTARKFFAKAAAEGVLLEDIVWVNPDKLEEKPIAWLEKGASPDKAKLLRNWKGN